MRPNLSVNLGLRYAMQMPFYARNNSYSTASVEDVWGISGYKPGCDMSNPTSANCNLFQQGVQTGTSPPTFENLAKGTKAYNADWNNLAPSIGVNWTPTPEAAGGGCCSATPASRPSPAGSAARSTAAA